jgi:hypothetical protein
MNTISQPPQIKRISGPKRFFGAIAGVTGALAANGLLAYSVSSFYTRNTKFVPYDTSSADLTTKLFRSHNPLSNPPGCIDHAIKQIPYGKLPEKYLVKKRAGLLGPKAVDDRFLQGCVERCWVSGAETVPGEEVSRVTGTGEATLGSEGAGEERLSGWCGHGGSL